MYDNLADEFIKFALIQEHRLLYDQHVVQTLGSSKEIHNLLQLNAISWRFWGSFS